MIKTISILFLALVGVLAMSAIQEASALLITPDLDVNQDNGGVTLEPCSTITLSDLRTPSLAHFIKWEIDGNSFPDGTSVIIPNDLTPGIHMVEFEIPHTLRFTSDVSFATSTRDDFKFTIAPPDDPAIQCSESPNALDFTVQTLVTGDTSRFVTIYFAEHVSDPTDDYLDLTITFSLQDESLYPSLSPFTGVAGDGTPTVGDTLTVTTPAVVFTPLDAQSFLNTKFLIDYTVTNLKGLSDSGVITVQFADFFTDIKSVPYTIDTGLYGLSTVELLIPHNEVTEFVVAEIDDDRYTAEFIILTIGIGNASGTLSIVPATASMGPILSYAPAAGFVGTETFPYTATFRGITSSSTLHIVVSAQALVITPDLDVNQDNGGVTLEPCSTVTLSDLPLPDRSDTIEWFIDEKRHPYGSSIIIPSNLTPGVHKVTFEIAANIITAPDGTIIKDPDGGVTFTGGSRSTFDFTIAPPDDPTLQCSDPPFAPDFAVEVLFDAPDQIFIPFSAHASDPLNVYFDLDIVFTLRDPTLLEQFNSLSGAHPPTVPSGEFIVVGRSIALDPVVNLDSRDFVNILIDYTVTDPGGASASGVITISYVNFVGTIVAAPYTVSVEKLFRDSQSTIPLQISGYRAVPSVHVETMMEQFADAIFIRPTGIGNGSESGTLDSSFMDCELNSFCYIGIGDQSGTLSFTVASANSGVIHRYTPAPGFVGTETFDYIASIGRILSDSSKLHLVVPAPVCSTSITEGVAFGDVDIGETSDTSDIFLDNTGNADAQVMIKGDNWKSVADGKDIMNVGVTKYTLTRGEFYTDKTALTSTAVDIGGPLGELDKVVILQLLIDLLDDSFRGDAAQEFTFSTECYNYD